MRTLWPRRLFKVAGWLLAAIAVSYSVLLIVIWSGRMELQVSSTALGQTRAVTVFNGTDGSAPGRWVYSLDGEGARHGLLQAAHGSIIAWLHGQSAPVVVAVHTGRSRDVDLRPDTVKPAYWRPTIKGRGAQFDVFLIGELRAAVENRFGKPAKQYLFGHSLGGFYAIDMVSRRSDHGFDGLFVFSPTFSHDLSLLGRLGKACEHSAMLYVNIGLESRRDTAVFERARVAFAKEPLCKANVNLSWHPGMIHQIVMVTGQVEALSSIF